MASDNYKKFRESIKEPDPAENQAIKGEYRGDEKVRKLWPIILGFDEQGEEAVLCYQYEVAGDPPDDPRPLKNLRCFKIAFFTGAVTRIKFPSSGNPPKFEPKQVKKQTCVEDVRYYRAVKPEE